MSIPDLIKLWNAVHDRVEEVEKSKRVKEDLKKIEEAFSEKDPDKLNAIFNSK